MSSRLFAQKSARDRQDTSYLLAVSPEPTPNPDSSMSLRGQPPPELVVNPRQEATTLSPLRALSTMTAFHLLAACPSLIVDSMETKAASVLSPRVLPVPRTVSATKESSPTAYTDGVTEITHFYAAQRLRTAGPGASPSFCFSVHLLLPSGILESFSLLHFLLPLISSFRAGLLSA